MCGIVAVISKAKWGMSRDEVDMFSDLLYIDALRGMDSTGTFMVNTHGDVSILKEASDASTFRGSKEFADLMRESVRMGVALVGHNRAATRGVISDQNAHPFVVDDRITLVHNGTLYGDHKKLADTEVDSHAIAHLIHKHGDDVEAAIQEVSGAYALIWSDFKNQSINILRNSQRPMFWVETDKCWIYCSERNMIEWLRYRYDKINFIGEVVSQPPGTLTTFTRKDSEWDVNSKEIKLTKTYAPTSAPAGGQGGSFHQWGYNGEYIDDDGVVEYFGLSKEEKDWLKKPTCDMPEREEPKSKKVTLTERLDYAENKIATDLSMNVLFTEFADKYNTLSTDTWYRATCVDFDQWDINEDKKGSYLYATLDKMSAVVRVFVMNNEYSDYDLLDMSLNNNEMEFYIRSKSWRAYKDKQGGFVLLYATAVRPITADRKTLLEMHL